MMHIEVIKKKINQGLNLYIEQNFGNLSFVPQTLIPLRIENVSMTEIGWCETVDDCTFKGKAQAVYAVGDDESTSILFLEGRAHIEEDKQNNLIITILGDIILQK